MTSSKTTTVDHQRRSYIILEWSHRARFIVHREHPEGQKGSGIGWRLGKGPKDHRNIRISHSGPQGQYEGDTSGGMLPFSGNHGLWDPYVHAVPKGAIRERPRTDVCSSSEG